MHIESIHFRVLTVTTALLCVLALSARPAAAADHLCNPATASTIDRGAGVTVQKVTLSGAWGSSDATVFLPDQEVAAGGVVFSHSRIHTDDGTTDMLPIALTLARAGAAVIVADRTIQWPSTESNMNREGAAVFCATRWLIANVRVLNATRGTPRRDGVGVRSPFAYVGPRVCDPRVQSACELAMPFNTAPYHLHVWVPVAETEGGDNTAAMISGGLKQEKFIQQHLELAPIAPLASAR